MSNEKGSNFDKTAINETTDKNTRDEGQTGQKYFLAGGCLEGIVLVRFYHEGGHEDVEFTGEEFKQKFIRPKPVE
jgi:hypothetical protein